ncbi:hypothetical protein ACKI1O_07135 [Streptomyces scabiei]
MLVPTLRCVRRRWESSDDRYVEVDHLLSRHVSAALRHAYARAARTRAADMRQVLLVCLPGERHTSAGGAHRRTGGARAARTDAGPFGAGRGAEGRGTKGRPGRRRPVVAVPQHRRPPARPAPRPIRRRTHGARTRSRVLLCGPGRRVHPDLELLLPFNPADAVRITVSAGRPGGDASPERGANTPEPV